MAVSTITLSELTFPDITGKTIKIWGQVIISPGTYTVGGLPMGLINFADGRTVDFNAFLRCEVWDEEPQNSGNLGYVYVYSPVGDVLQIFHFNGTELVNGETINLVDPALNPDAPVPTSPHAANTILFEATFDRTGARG
jgi:hypothetical protein